MKTKIIAALKTKYANLGFSDKAIEGVAAFLANTTTEESQIETAIGGVENLLKAFQGDADSRVNGAIQKTKEELAKTTGASKDDEPKPDTPPAGETPTDAAIRKLTELVTKQSETISNMQNQGTVSTRQAALELALKDAPAILKNNILANFAYMNFDSQEKFDEFLNKTTTDVTTAKQAIADGVLGGIPKPTISAVAGNAASSFVDDLKANTQAQLDKKTAAAPTAATT